MFFGKLFGKKSEEDELFDSLEPSSSLSSSSPEILVAPPAYNIILIGSANAHKAELLKVLCDCQPTLFETCYKEQIGINFKRVDLMLSIGNKVKLNIWDITGKEDFERIVPQYCRGAHGIMFYYDLKDTESAFRDTFYHTKSFIEKNNKMLLGLRIPIYLVGIFEKQDEKLDKKKDDPKGEVLKLADKIRARAVNCSLDDDEKGIKEIFKMFVNDISKKYQAKPGDKESENNNGDIPPRPSSSPPLPPSAIPTPTTTSSSSSSSSQQQQNSPSSLISICKYEGSKNDVEVQRNEDGLFGNYKEDKGYGILCYNVSVLGNPRIGKSCLCVRCTEGKPNSNSLTKSVWMRSFALPYNKYLRLCMIESEFQQGGTDTCLEPSYSHSHAVLLCYDITDRASFNVVRRTAAAVRSSAMRGAVVMVVGLRYDAAKKCVCVAGSEGKALAERHGMHFRECSGKDNVGVRELFAKILLELQKIDSFAIPIRTDDANRMLPLSVSTGEEHEKKHEGKHKGKTEIVGHAFGDFDYFFKIMIVGDHLSGKSSLMLRYADDTYTDTHKDSVGVDFKIKNVRTIDGKSAKLQIWDPSNEYLNSRVPTYRGSHAILICYDVTNQESFESVKKIWIHEVDRSISKNIPIVIVGTKCDLPPVVDFDVAQEFAESVNAFFMLCSAKTGESVNELFEKTVSLIVFK